MASVSDIITFFLAYKILKKYAVSGMDRPKENSWTHLQIAVLIGNIAFILGQYFLLTTTSSLILSETALLTLIMGALLISDIQDILYRKKPIWLYGAIFIEYIIWSIIGLVAFLSGQFVEGSLFLFACFSRIADLLHLFNVTVAEKET